MADSIGGVSDLDRQIEQLRRCEIIKESEVSKILLYILQYDPSGLQHKEF